MPWALAQPVFSEATEYRLVRVMGNQREIALNRLPTEIDDAESKQRSSLAP